MGSVRFIFKLPVRWVKRRNRYVAVCPALDIASQGPTKKKSTENLREAISLFLSDCYDRGTLASVLKDSGFVGAKPLRKPTTKYRDDDSIEVPIALLANEQQKAASA